MYSNLLETVRNASVLLGSGAEDAILSFLQSQQASDGGFTGRSGNDSDIYYTMYAAMLYAAFTGGIPQKLAEYIKKTASDTKLDFIHTCALGRLYALMSGGAVDAECKECLQKRLAEYRSLDGGFSHSAKFAEYGTPYGAFLAAAAYDELQVEIQDKELLVASVTVCRTPDSGFANQRGALCGTANATAAAVAYLAVYNHSGGIPAGTSEFVMKLYADNGGFRASGQSPFADVLSTGSLLFAMFEAGLSLSPEKAAATLGMIEHCWTDSGGFTGYPEDSVSDCEYTFYALLAVGALARTE